MLLMEIFGLFGGNYENLKLKRYSRNVDNLLNFNYVIGRFDLSIKSKFDSIFHF